jgi:hypothetical protein
MGIESGSNLPPEIIENNSLDKEWYTRFNEKGVFSVFMYLNGEVENRKKQKELFLSGEIEVPKLDYSKINTEDFKNRENFLLELKEDILNQEKNELIRQVYRWRINEKIADTRMLQAVAAGDSKKVGRYSRFVDGSPSGEIFTYTLQQLSKEIEKALSSDNPELVKAAKDFQELLPKNTNENVDFKLPDPEIFQKAESQTKMEFGDIFNIPAEQLQQKLNTEEIKAMMEKHIQSLGAEGWEVVISETAGSFAVDKEKNQVVFPKGTEGTVEVIRSLILHEIYTHVARRINGERSRLMLLGLGLDRYRPGEEGIATMREQVLTGKVDDFSGLFGHFAISLARGLDGQPRNFREVFEILKKYHIMREIQQGSNKQEAEEKANNLAYSRCIRTFRGTNCATRGECYMQDITYREGNIGVWNIIDTNSKEMMRFNVGKYDPGNPRHIWILDQLGITDQDLEKLNQ